MHRFIRPCLRPGVFNQAVRSSSSRVVVACPAGIRQKGGDNKPTSTESQGFEVDRTILAPLHSSNQFSPTPHPLPSSAQRILDSTSLAIQHISQKSFIFGCARCGLVRVPASLPATSRRRSHQFNSRVDPAMDGIPYFWLHKDLSVMV